MITIYSRHTVVIRIFVFRTRLFFTIISLYFSNENEYDDIEIPKIDPFLEDIVEYHK
jgi:hypothetical protein